MADALSRLDIDESLTPTNEVQMAEFYAEEKLSPDIFPLNYSVLKKFQDKDVPLQKKLNKSAHLQLHPFHGGDKQQTTKLIVNKNKKIVVPNGLQKHIVRWYHKVLCHPGRNRTEETIRQHFTFENLRKEVHRQCATCLTCQMTKRDTKKYGLIPEKEAEANPWEILCVDLIGPYTLKRKHKPSLKLWCLTMIDPATGWFEMKEIENKTAANIAEKVQQVWLTRYPKPDKIIFDKGTEFMREFAEMIENDYGIAKHGSNKRNPQSNSVLERIHQTIGNMVRTFEITEQEVDEDDPWSGLLAAVMFATRATYHTTLKATPMQLVFGRDAILNTKFEANWRNIKESKQRRIRINNEQENKKRIPHKYTIGDKVLYREDDKSKYGTNPYSGPYEIRAVRENGSVTIKIGAVL